MSDKPPSPRGPCIPCMSHVSGCVESSLEEADTMALKPIAYVLGLVANDSTMSAQATILCRGTL